VNVSFGQAACRYGHQAHAPINGESVVAPPGDSVPLVVHALPCGADLRRDVRLLVRGDRRYRQWPARLRSCGRRLS